LEDQLEVHIRNLEMGPVVTIMGALVHFGKEDSTYYPRLA